VRNVIPMSLIATCRAGAASRAQAAFLASLTLADVAANAFAIGAVQNSVDVEEAVEFGPHIRCVGRAAYIGDCRDAWAAFNPGSAAVYATADGTANP